MPSSPMPRPALRRPQRAAGWLLALGLVLAGCSDDGADGPDPTAAAEELAAALASGELDALDEVILTGPGGADAAAEHARVVEGLLAVSGSGPEGGSDTGSGGESEGESEGGPRVGVADVEAAGEAATAVLTWTWPLGEHEWSYQVRAPLDLVDGRWTTAWSRTLVEPSLAEDEVLDAVTLAARRGEVLGAGGRALVTDRPVVRFGVDRSAVPQRRAGASAARLARLVGVDVQPYVARVEAAGERAFVEAITFRRDEVPPEVAAGHDAIPGVLALGDELPLAPTREFAAPILGTVGEVTAEMVEEQPERYRVGDRAGLSGLQARYDEQLQGRPGVVVHAVDPQRDERPLFEVPAEHGDPLRLTLDPRLQLGAERLLADIGPASALVALRPSDGALLAAANGPGTDGYNVATYGQYAPGSTFKVVSSLALLRAGLGPDSPVACTPELTVDGKRFENYDDYPASALGRIPLRTAVAASCNTALIAEADRLGRRDLADAAASLGLGVDHDLGFPAFLGSVPPPASDVELAADVIGQGKVLASPMAMAAVIGSAQRGEIVVPRLVEDVEVAAPDGVDPPSPAEAEQLRALLREVVTSGSGAGLADLPGPPAIAKTGTAEFVRDGELLTHAWMVAAQGDLAVAVFVEEGASGSGTAGPILEAFLRLARG